jgi:hypothetical protein
MTQFQLQQLRAVIADDAYAMSFQSFGQYRSALLSFLDASSETPSAWVIMPTQLTEAMKDAAKRWTFMPNSMYLDLVNAAGTLRR